MAKAEDAVAITELFARWFPMSIWRDCITYHKDRAPAVIERGIKLDYQPFILARGDFGDGDLVGLISWHYDSRYTDRIGVLDEVFVLPQFVRSDLGLRLVAGAVDIARAEGARVFNFPIASGMPVQRSLINMLLKRFRAEPVGVILRKVL